MLLEEESIWLREDRGEFDELRDDKRRQVAMDKLGEVAGARRAAVTPPPPRSRDSPEPEEVEEARESDPDEEAAEKVEEPQEGADEE